MIPTDLNCDLGEGEPRALARALMRFATSVNIACAGHAGSLADMEFCVGEAQARGLHVGAHPGLPSRETFGRLSRPLTAAEAAEIVVLQTAGLAAVAHRLGASLHHVKLHGALYHMADKRVAEARAIASAIQKYFPGVVLFAKAHGKLHREADSCGIEVWPEAFADRGYTDDGQLVPRGLPHALVDCPRVAAERVHHLVRYSEILSIRGRPVKVSARTLCVHSDSPQAVALAREVRRHLPVEPSQ